MPLKLCDWLLFRGFYTKNQRSDHKTAKNSKFVNYSWGYLIKIYFFGSKKLQKNQNQMQGGQYPYKF